MLVGLEAVDGDGQATMIALEGGELVTDRGDLGEELVHAGFEIGGGEISHRRDGDGRSEAGGRCVRGGRTGQDRKGDTRWVIPDDIVDGLAIQR